MAAKVKSSIYFLLSFPILCHALEEQPHKKFEYKYSFKPPYLAQTDGTVPFWEYGGNAIASSENVRIAPSLRSQKGAIWNKLQIDFDWWEVDLVFRITGRGRVGADGLAFWYTSSKGLYNGTVFGSSDEWNGLGIFFDSFDNDNKHNNPYVMAVLNDGTRTFDHTNDGGSQILAGCLRDFRNKPFPTRARIEYYHNTLTLLFHGGMTNNEQDYEMCFRVENIVLPKKGYFGVSAATGGLADDHDVLHFLTTSLYPLNQIKYHAVSSEEEAKISEEYQNYQNKLEKQKEEYLRQHPEEQRKSEELGDWFESDNQRELRQIFSGQSQIFDVIRTLQDKLDYIIKHQEKTSGSLAQVDSTGKDPQRVNAESSSDRNEKEKTILLDNQYNILSTSNEIYSAVTSLKSKVDAIYNSGQMQPPTLDHQSFITEIKDGLNMLKNAISHTNTEVKNIGSSCLANNCVSTTTFLVFSITQMIFILGYNIYRKNKETQAKKFY